MQPPLALLIPNLNKRYFGEMNSLLTKQALNVISSLHIFVLYRRNRASKVIKALRDFAMKSWHDLEVLTGEMLEDYSASDDDILQEYIKLVAEHAFKSKR